MGLLDIIDKKTLRVFAHSSVKNDTAWLRVFRDALVKFNGLKLGVTLVEEPNDPPDPLTLAGAHVQFATGAGTITARARGKPQSDTLVGTELHGHTFTFRDPGIAKAFIFVPATPHDRRAASRRSHPPVHRRPRVAPRLWPGQGRSQPGGHAGREGR
jgi:hypothetical protein